VSFKPRIIRFDDEHAAVPTPVGAGPSAPLGASLVTVADEGQSDGHRVETSPHDPTHDTIRGEEFETITNFDLDDALLGDAMMQCLARQLSDDADRLAKRFPADGWVPPALEECSPRPLRGTQPTHWRRAIAAVAAMGACFLMTVGAQSESAFHNHPASETDSGLIAPSELQPTNHITYQDGDDAIWGPNPIDDSQHGDVQFGGLYPGSPNFESDGTAGGGAFDILSNPTHDALRELIPADAHEHCDVSM
jgi:hypothetical protein